MTHQTKVGIVVMALSLSTGALGLLLIQRAHAMPAPVEPERRTLTGTVVEILVQPCGNANHRRNCKRPVVSYGDSTIDGGQPQHLVSRTGYSPSSPHAKGERVKVYVHRDGAVWLGSEWDAHHARRRQEYESARDFPLTMGWILIGCAAFGLLLGAGVTFWVDRSDEQLPARRRRPSRSINP